MKHPAAPPRPRILDLEAELRPSELQRDLLEVVACHMTLETGWPEIEQALQILFKAASPAEVGKGLLTLAAEVLCATAAAARTFCLDGAATALHQAGLLSEQDLRTFRRALESALLVSTGAPQMLCQPTGIGGRRWLRAGYLVLRVAVGRLQVLTEPDGAPTPPRLDAACACNGTCSVRAGRCGWQGCRSFGTTVLGHCRRPGHDGPPHGQRSDALARGCRIRSLLPFTSKVVTRSRARDGHRNVVTWHGGPHEREVEQLLNRAGVTTSHVVLVRIEHDIVTQTGIALALVEQSQLLGSETAALRRLELALIAMPERMAAALPASRGRTVRAHATRYAASCTRRARDSNALHLLRYVRATAGMTREELSLYLPALMTCVDEDQAGWTARALCTEPAA